MDLPEIRYSVAEHLDSAQLAAAAAVCKSWNATFTPFLYSKVVWKVGDVAAKDKKKQSAFQAKSAHVREVEVYTTSGPKAPAISMGTFTCIESLEIHFQIYEPIHWAFILRLLRQNPELHTLKLDFCDCGDIPPEILKTLSKSCPKLKAFHTCNALISVKDMEHLLLTMCNQLEILIMDHVHFIDHTRDANHQHSQIKLSLPRQFLRMTDLRVEANISPTQQLELFKRCPQLVAMKVMLPDGRTHIPADLIYEIFGTCCPLVGKIGLECCSLSDAEFAKAIDLCRSRLTIATVFGTDFGPKAMQLLMERHAATLTLVNVTECHSVTSVMNLQILTSCPNLLKFHGSDLKAKDILGISDDAKAVTEQDLSLIQPQEWPCKSLRILDVYICGLHKKPAAWHRLIIQHIAKFKKLEELNISPSASSYGKAIRSNGESVDGLDLRLANGMDAMSDFKRLRALLCLNLRMKMGVEDVRWMTKAWPEMKNVFGVLNSDRRKEEVLLTILKSRGVFVRRGVSPF
ncbi:hypothetical protein BGZ80_009917 [Entomortierella chlamydospora]|uniref:F-box domain-containing protein n=1 Tax=Entomortierella chlamydospora TaxID=101097 RepID=A0A9P6MWF0_9FUNG|nr:hypothetical protein BGZ80_009917 [Entomortierella chlamydospora]